MLQYWILFGNERAITTDNASDMVSAMNKLNDVLHIRNNKSRPIIEFHVRYIEHGVNLAICECFKDVHDNIG